MTDDRFPLRLCVKCFAPYRALFCMNCLESNEYAQGQLNGWNAAQDEIKKKRQPNSGLGRGDCCL